MNKVKKVRSTSHTGSCLQRMPENAVDPATIESDGEIVGLHRSGNGESSTSHDASGEFIGCHGLVRFRHATIETSPGVFEDALKAVWVRDAVETCVVGFLSRFDATASYDKYFKKFGQITELYDHSEEPVKKLRSERMGGVAAFILLDHVLSKEDVN